MAFMNQEKKAVIAANLKSVMPKGWKFTLSVRHYSTIVCTIKSAPVDLLAINNGHDNINHYHLDHNFGGEVLKELQAIVAALNTDNHDRSDSQTDYFDVGHYVNLRIGAWDKPFAFTGQGA